MRILNPVQGLFMALASSLILWAGIWMVGSWLLNTLGGN